jgi:ATP-dependent Clp protease ATP-binding subunit ClpC
MDGGSRRRSRAARPRCSAPQAEKRRMRLRALPAEPQTHLFAVSGFAAYSLLRGEHRLHVFEEPAGKGFDRNLVRVRVAPQPEQPATQEALLDQAQAALAAAPGDKLVIVRRYRERPSPLVRDSVLGWRTGRLDLVLGGDFDLFCARERLTA